MAWPMWVIEYLIGSLISFVVCCCSWFIEAPLILLARLLLSYFFLQYMFCVASRTMWYESAGLFLRIRWHCPSILLIWRNLLLLPSLCQHVWWRVWWYFCGWNLLSLWTVCCWWILCGTSVFGSVQVMSLNSIHWLSGMHMWLFCLYFCVIVLICPSVLVAFFYIQKVLSDGRIPKLLELHLTDTIHWLLFRPVKRVCHTMMVENILLYMQGHWRSVPWNLLLTLLLHFCCVCLVVTVLFAFLIRPVLFFSGLLTLNFPICASWGLFLIFAVLVSLFNTIAWIPQYCDSWWVRLVSYCCRFIPLPWCTCFLIVIVLGTALSGWRIQCFFLRIRWCIGHVPCVLEVSLFGHLRGSALRFGGPDIFSWLVQMFFWRLVGF